MLQLATIEQEIEKKTIQDATAPGEEETVGASSPMFMSPMFQKAQKIVRKLTEHKSLSKFPDVQLQTDNTNTSTSPQRIQEPLPTMRSLAPSSDVPRAFGDQV